MTTTPKPVNKILLPYAAIMVVLSIFAQVVVVMRGNQIDAIAGLGLVPAFVYYLYFQITSRASLSRIRFGLLVSHVTAFLIVNLSYHIPAAILTVQNINDTQGPDVALSAGWFGVLFAMFGMWGIGLLIHLIASIAMRGYEEVTV